MTDAQRTEIRMLAAICEEAEQRLHWASYQNVARDPSERAQQAARYAELRAEAVEARGHLERAIASVGAA